MKGIKKLIVMLLAIGMMANLSAQEDLSMEGMIANLSVEENLSMEGTIVNLNTEGLKSKESNVEELSSNSNNCKCFPPSNLWSLTPHKMKDSKTGKEYNVVITGHYILKNCPVRGACDNKKCTWLLGVAHFGEMGPPTIEWESVCGPPPVVINPPATATSRDNKSH